MRILKIEIERFGKLKQLTVEPAPGLTLIEGENESGKSTLLAFLRFAFYGFPRRGGADGEERDKRLSWEDKTAAGQLTLEHGGRSYRIVRRAHLRGSGTRETLGEELKVLCLPEGETADLGGKSPGEYFLGLPPELYEGSLCMTQSGADRVCAPGVGEAMGDLLFAGEHSFSAGEAAGRLALARRELQHLKGRGGRVAELEDRLAALDGCIASGKEESKRLAALRADVACCRADLELERRDLTQIAGALERTEIERTLALFEDRAAALAEVARCEALLEAEGEATPVDHARVEREEAALRGSLELRAQIARLTPERDALQGGAREAQILQAAAVIEEQGGSVGLLRRVERNRARCKKFTVTGAIFLVIGLMLLSLLLLPQLRLYGLIGAAGAAVVSVLLFIAAACAAAVPRQLTEALGVPRRSMLRTYLEQVRRDAELITARQTRLRAVEEELAMLQTRLNEAERELIALRIDPTILQSPDRAMEHLEQLRSRQSRQSELQAQVRPALERAAAVAEALTRRLEGMDEQALRTRIAALPVADGSREALLEERDRRRAAVAALERKYAEAERAETALAATVGDTDAAQRERYAVAAELECARRRLAAVCLAQRAMETATDELRRSVTPRLGEETDRIFAALTNGAHGTLRLSPEFGISLEENGVPRPLSHFSAGCRDAAHLALRLALLETLSGESLPLFFDEALARLDDTRARAMLSAILGRCQSGGQCLLLTCHGREAAMLEGVDGVKHILL